MPPIRLLCSRSCWPRRLRWIIPGCSRTSFRSLQRRPASRCGYWRRGLGRHWRPRRMATPIWFWSTIPRPSRNSSLGRRRRPQANRLERFHHGRTTHRPGPYRRRARCSRGSESDLRRPGALCLARRQERHRRARTSLVARRRRSTRSKRAAGSWYRDIGGGMGAALNAAAAMGAYTISDRGTWLSFGNKRDLAVLVEGDPRLLNRYDVILLDPKSIPRPSSSRRAALPSGWSRPKAKPRSATTRSTASSCSIPRPPRRNKAPAHRETG